MVGAPDIDHVGETATELVIVIGDVIGEVSPAAVGLLQRTVDLVAEFRGPEQRLLAVLPVIRLLAFGWVEPALIDEAEPRQFLEDAIHHAGLNESALRGVDLDIDTKR